MRSARLLQPVLSGFVAGFLSTLIFHQGTWAILYWLGIVPADLPPWPLNAIPPLDVPFVISKAFWGGVWGGVFSLLSKRLNGPSYWLAWLLAGAIAPTLVGTFFVPLVKGQKYSAFQPARFVTGCAVNAAWGLGTALILTLFHKWLVVVRFVESAASRTSGTSE